MDNYYDLLNEMRRSIERAIRGPGGYTTCDTSPLRCEEVERNRSQSRAEIADLAKKLLAAGDIEGKGPQQWTLPPTPDGFSLCVEHGNPPYIVSHNTGAVFVLRDGKWVPKDIEGKATSQTGTSR